MPTPSLPPPLNVSSLDGPRDWLRSVSRRLRGRGRTRGALLLLTAALVAGSAVFGGGTVHADPVPGEVTNLRLSSGAPGELTITWDAPSDAPADYRVAWARADLSWLSWDASDETHRGSSYPGGADTSLTLTGLTGGETYKVRMRSRYNPGTSDGWSGPWTDEARQRVTAAATATPVPTAAPTPAPPSDAVTNLRLSSDAPGELTITWDAPSDAPADYRVAWARDDLSYLSWNASDETHRGSSYPGGADTSLTLTGLTGGETYKARMRSRYNPGTSEGRSGPWTDEATQRVRTVVTQSVRTVVEPEEDEEEELIAQQQQGSDEVILTSNYTGDYAFSNNSIFVGRNATHFTTGDNELGYLLTKVTHGMRVEGGGGGTAIVGAGVNADNAGIPGTELYAFPDQTFTHTIEQPVTHVGEVLLEPNKKYWIVLTKRAGSTGNIALYYKGSADVATGLDDWTLATNASYFSNRLVWATFNTPYAIRLEGVVLVPATDEPDDRDFPMDASTLGRLRIGTTSTGVLDATDDKRSGDLLRIEGLTAGNSYRVRAWFGTSKADSATADRGGAIGLQSGRAGTPYISSVSPYNDNLLDDGRASFAFPVDEGQDYYVDLVAPAFRPPGGLDPAYTYYGPYSLEIYDLGPTQQLLGVSGQTCDTDNRICTGGTVTYSEGYGIKASNICVNYRCSNDARFPEFNLSGYPIDETYEVSVGNNPASKNLLQAVALRAGTTGPTAKFKLDRIGAFVHGMTSGSIPKAAIHARSGNTPGAKLFDLEPLYNDDGHIDYFLAPQGAQALTRNTFYAIVFSEGGGSSDYYKLYVTKKFNEDDDGHPNWGIANFGVTRDDDASSPTWSVNTNIPQIQIYAGVAP